jgi:hypothetical protein
MSIKPSRRRFLQSSAVGAGSLLSGKTILLDTPKPTALPNPVPASERRRSLMQRNKYQELLAMKKGKVLEFARPGAHCVLAPDMGGRVFGEVGELPVHRIDLDCVAEPDRPFNNFGGGNFWPAPEGGKFAFNYRGNEWYAQECINRQPFEVVCHGEESAVIQKRVALRNRLGTVLDALMRREFTMLARPPAELTGKQLRGCVSYRTVDSFKIQSSVRTEQALIGAWTLEQFDASPTTIAFCIVPEPRNAINFDFYKPPYERITYYSHGFTYQTDGLSRGQIGIRKAAGASFIAFHDMARSLLCLREVKGGKGDLYFNMADNDQPRGPFSAADNYSIFNSDTTVGSFFELETVGGAQVENGFLKGSELVMETSFAVFEDPQELRNLVRQNLGG